MSSPNDRQPAHSPADAVYLTADDLARRYKTSTRTIFRWADSGLLPRGIKFGALRRWSLRSIEGFERSGYQIEREGDQ